jgi:hypothetical protein
VASGRARAPLAAAALMGALGSAGYDLRCPSTCAQPLSAAATHNGEASRRHWDGEEAEEALYKLKVEAEWSAWVEEGCNGGGAGICWC